MCCVSRYKCTIFQFATFKRSSGQTRNKSHTSAALQKLSYHRVKKAGVKPVKPSGNVQRSSTIRTTCHIIQALNLKSEISAKTHHCQCDCGLGSSVRRGTLIRVTVPKRFGLTLGKPLRGKKGFGIFAFCFELPIYHL